ncbi:MAG: B12-binding domain-containing radical SAM protein [Thermoplasmata archaeon]|nr:MAG: B12-binding domain-containing radical SAM protein [Thermoplasmata archaeon]
MRILIVENVWMEGRKLKFFDRLFMTSFSILPTLYARQLAAVTPKKHFVKVINERYSNINFDEKYDVVNINFTTSTAPRAYEIADVFRKKNVTVVLSGLHASALPEEAKMHADCVLIGRGETSWPKLLDDLEKNNLQPYYYPVHINGLYHVPPTEIRLPGFVITGAVEATRGCPYRCDFCPEAHIPGGSRFYMRPVDEVVAEIKSLPQKAFIFYDSSLTINPDYSKKLFNKMKKLNKKFFCNGNVDVLARDEELIRLSKEAGCVSWLIGFESIYQEALDSVGKKTNRVSEYSTAVKNIHNHKMAVIGCFIFGFDTDTSEVFDKTLNAIYELQLDAVDFCILTPFPGTPLYKKLEDEDRILTRDWSKYNMKNVVFEPKNMTAEELLQGVREIYQEFYHPSETIKRIIKSIGLGFYPFLLSTARNIIANMNKKLLQPVVLQKTESDKKRG